MSYYDLATLAQDGDFYLRIAAAVELELDVDDASTTWAAHHQWAVAASPGFADAYASAVAGDVPTPGRDPSVISDEQILSAVVAVAADDVEPPP